MTGSETVRWLFDLEDGGKPAAFKCLLPANWRPGKRMGSRCNEVTKSLGGMRRHQKAKHGFVVQKKMFEEKNDAVSENAG